MSRSHGGRFDHQQLGSSNRCSAERYGPRGGDLSPRSLSAPATRRPSPSRAGVGAEQRCWGDQAEAERPRSAPGRRTRPAKRPRSGEGHSLPGLCRTASRRVRRRRAACPRSRSRSPAPSEHQRVFRSATATRPSWRRSSPHPLCLCRSSQCSFITRYNTWLALTRSAEPPPTPTNRAGGSPPRCAPSPPPTIASNAHRRDHLHPFGGTSHRVGHVQSKSGVHAWSPALVAFQSRTFLPERTPSHLPHRQLHVRVRLGTSVLRMVPVHVQVRHHAPVHEPQLTQSRASATPSARSISRGIENSTPAPATRLSGAPRPQPRSTASPVRPAPPRAFTQHHLGLHHAGRVGEVVVAPEALILQPRHRAVGRRRRRAHH